MPEPAQPKSLPTLLEELRELVVTYARQETVEPLKGLGRFIAFGVAGSLVLGIGLVLLGLAGLRALQTETGSAFHGKLSWLPYVFAVIGCAVIAGLAVSRVGRGRKAGRR